MIKALQEGNKLTLTMHSSIDSGSWYDSEEKEENSVSNVDELEKILSKNKNAAIIDIFINSPGGDVFEGIGIYNILKRSRAYKRVYIDGFACSIASVIAMVGNQIYMPKSSLMMIHNCWTMVCGNAHDLRKMADDLDKINGLSIEAYMTKFTGERKELVNLLDGETYLSADECLEKGFCTKIIEDGEETETMAREALDTTTSIQNSKLEQLKSIQESIKKLNVETKEIETVNETGKVETVNEVEKVNEANDETMKPDDIQKYIKEEKQLNTLQKFFHVDKKKGN